MRLEIRATDVKEWFQYRCERKLIYATLPREYREDIPVDEVHEPHIRATEGIDFERLVVRELQARGVAVLRPLARAKAIPPALLAAFLRGERPERFAYQANLTETTSLRRDLGLPEHVSILDGRPDLLEWVEKDGERLLRVVDIKHSRRPTHYHRAQIAFYVLMLRGQFNALGIKAPPLHPQANIWFIGDGDNVWEERAGLFPVNGYEEMIRDFFRRQIPSISSTRVGRGHDESFFHLYFKCEQCEWLDHCRQSISDDMPREDWDISAVPGMSHLSKATLHKAGLRSLSQLAEAKHLSSETWALRTRGKLLRARASALLNHSSERIPGHHTWLMPPRIDVPVFLLIDCDPVANHLVTLGGLVGGAWAQEPMVEVITRPDEELPALKRVFGHLIGVLQQLDAHNAALNEGEGLRAHIFVYEPSEANDLRRAMAGHLEDDEIRSSLINLVRLFPPEEVRAPEPEYRGAHHLPASALRSVIEQLYVLPAKVSYDLARVSAALAEASPPLDHPYRPEEMFRRQFSARLSIEVTRRLEKQPQLIEATRQDILARLRAMESLCQWVLSDNARSEESFLRLKKAPFRFQEQFHPLDAMDFDVLLAQELLQSRAERLAALVELARPAEERRERLRCYSHLTLVDQRSGRGGSVLTFEVPPASRNAELTPGTFGLILTDDDPDLRMDPTLWPDCSVQLLPSRDPTRVRVKVWSRAWRSGTMRRLIQRSLSGQWFLDQAHIDINAPRMDRLLRYLGQGNT